MKIGIAGPMSLDLLINRFNGKPTFPVGYPAPIISHIINALIENGHEVVAYTTSVGVNESLIYIGDHLTVCIAPREAHAARDMFLSERQGLLALMKKFPVDLINAHWSYEFAWAALDTGCPTLVTLHDHALTILRYKTDFYRLNRLFMNWFVLWRSKALSTNSQYLYSKLTSRDKQKARIVPNFYDPKLNNDNYKDHKPSRIILSVNDGFGKRKNISTGLHAFAKVRESNANIEYHLVGDGMQEGGPAYQFALRNRLDNGVQFCGKIPYHEVLAKMKEAAVFLHPSREESFGMAVLEAMVSGTPVVGGSHSGNIPFLLDGGKAGLLCDINSAESIALAISTIMSSKNIACGISDRAHLFARQNYSQEVVINKYIKYYEDILKNRK